MEALGWVLAFLMAATAGVLGALLYIRVKESHSYADLAKKQREEAQAHAEESVAEAGALARARAHQTAKEAAERNRDRPRGLLDALRKLTARARQRTTDSDPSTGDHTGPDEA